MRQVAVWLNKVTHGSLHPDTVTVVGVVMHLPTALALAAEQFKLAAVLLIVFGLFDTIDGELARLQKVDSPKGMVLDASTDRLKEVMLYAGVAYWLSTGPYVAWTFVAVIACGSSISSGYVKAKGEAAIALKNKTIGHYELNRVFSDGLLSFEVRMTILVLGLLSNQLLAATVIVAVLATYTFFERLITISRKL